MEFTVTVKQTISQERLEDLLCCAFEGGIGYWARIVDATWSSGVDYSHQLPVRGGAVRLGDSTGEGWPEGARPILSRDSIRRGLQTMADKYPRHWSDFVRENEDAITGDVFVQCVVFGEVVFG